MSLILAMYAPQAASLTLHPTTLPPEAKTR